MPDGSTKWRCSKITVQRRVCTECRRTNAGSSADDDARAKSWLSDGSISAGCRANGSTLNPASLIGIEFKKGSIVTGKLCDLERIAEILC